MKRKYLLTLLPWALLLLAIAGGVARETTWRQREAVMTKAEKLLTAVTTASCEAEERLALDNLFEWTQSAAVNISLRAIDRRVGQKIPIANMTQNGMDPVFELGIDTNGDRKPDHFYQIVLKNPANLGLLMRE